MIKQLLLKAKFSHIQNGFIIPLTQRLQPHFVNQHGSIQEDLSGMTSDDEDDEEEEKETEFKLEYIILLLFFLLSLWALISSLAL